MFILATMLIAVYIVAMAAVLINFKSEQIEIERESLREPYLDLEREIQHYLELILAEYSKNNTTISRSTAINMINKFLYDVEIINTARGVTSEIRFNSEQFYLSSKQPPYENTSDGKIYTSAISGNFSLRLSSISSVHTIIESVNVSFLAHVEIQDNSIIIQQAKGGQLTYVEVSSIYILNGSTTLFPTADPDHSGIYYFDGISSLENLGILNVTLPNGVSIFS